MKKDELIQLLTRFEGELQAKEIALATLKVKPSKRFFALRTKFFRLQAEKMKNFLSIGRLSSPTDPIGALLRDGQVVKDEHLNEEILLKSSAENSSAHLDELLHQQRKQIDVLEKSLEHCEKRCLSVSRTSETNVFPTSIFLLQLSQQLENERKEKTRFQSFQNLCLRLQEEKFQLRNEVKTNVEIFRLEFLRFSSTT